MTLKELNFFYKLSDNPIVSQVANELNISQSAISLAIKSLENKLGEKLFDRIGKKLILNDRGRYFKNISYTHFIALNDAKTVFKKNKIAGNLNIAASKTIANYIMPNIYYDFLNTYDKVNLDIKTLNSTDIIEKIKNTQLDFGLIETSCDETDIIKNKLCDDELILVTSDKNMVKKTFIDSIPKKWVLRELGSGTRDVFVKNLEKLDFKLDIFMQLNDFEEIKNVIIKNPDTISAMSEVVVKKELASQKLFKIEALNINFKREFHIIYHKNKTHNLLFNTFENFIMSNFTQFI